MVESGGFEWRTKVGIFYLLYKENLPTLVFRLTFFGFSPAFVSNTVDVAETVLEYLDDKIKTCCKSEVSNQDVCEVEEEINVEKKMMIGKLDYGTF